MRIFTALPLPESSVEALEERLFPLKELNPRWRWIPEENLHLTLIFLGDVDGRGIRLALESAEAAARETEPVAAMPGAFITLPHGRNAGVLALEIGKGREKLAALAARLKHGLMAAGAAEGYRFSLEKRAFKPHITVARRAGGAAGAAGAGVALRFPSAPSAPFAPDEMPEAVFRRLTVFRSDLRPGGAVYTPLAEFPLEYGLRPAGGA